MVKGDRDIPVAPHLKPPSGCPIPDLESIEQCSGPTNSSACLEDCPKTKDQRQIRPSPGKYGELLNRLPSPTSALDALDILFTETARAMEGGQLSTEEGQKLWDQTLDGLPKS